MPELPEVETVRVGLARLIVGKKIAGVWHDWPKSFPNADEDVRQFLIGAKILEIKSPLFVVKSLPVAQKFWAICTG